MNMLTELTKSIQLSQQQPQLWEETVPLEQGAQSLCCLLIPVTMYRHVQATVKLQSNVQCAS